VIDFLAPKPESPAQPGAAPDPVLFVFPHPDDDVFVGGTLSLLLRAGVRLHASWMTSGGYDGMAHARERELQQAMDIAGVENRHLLRLPDGGLIADLENACAKLVRLIVEVKPRVIIGSAFEGGHADHDATSFAIAESCRRAGWEVPLFEYPCYAPAADAPRGLRLSAFPAQALNVRQVDLDKRAMRCKESMARAYASQKQVFDLLEWRPSTREFFRECPKHRDHAHPPYPGLSSYAHWFNWRSRDRFERLSAAIASMTRKEPTVHPLFAMEGADSARCA
jgi:LmbE family N-acetylglucosaminyl deacetylase